VLLVAAGLCCIAARPGAAVAARAGGPIALTPAAGSQLDGAHDGYSVAVQPGGGVWQSIVVESNVDDGRVTVKLTGSGAAGKWAHPSTGVLVLGPHQRAPVPFTIAPPKDAARGLRTGTLTATVVDTDSNSPGVRNASATVSVAVNVLGAGAVVPPSKNPTGAAGATGALGSTGDPASTGTPQGATREPASTSDMVLLIAVVGAILLLVAGIALPPIIRSVRGRDRARPRLRLRLAGIVGHRRSVELRRRAERVADAAAASDALATVPPPKLSRADVRRAEQRRRVAERQERLRAERQRLREEAQRAAAEAWDERVRAMREHNEAEAKARVEAIEHARRVRAERAAALVADRRAAEERRLEQLRAIEERRREDTAARARQRLTELAARRQLGRETEAAIRQNAISEDLQRQLQNELSRAEVVQLRSEEVRDLARSWIVTPAKRKGDAPPPLPGEENIESRLVALPAPGAEPPASVTVDEPVESETAAPGPPPTRAREKVAVVALDIDALNARLQQRR
jgi:hypothetical protein